MALNTFLECTGSVVGWYGLLAPEIIEVLEASPSKPSVSSLFLMLNSFISTSRPDIRADSGAKMSSGPLVLWKQPGRKQCLNKEQPSLQNAQRKLQPCVRPTDPEPDHYIHLSVISSPIPAFALCSDPVMNSAERSRMITAVLMAVSIFHSFWMQNVMLLLVSALQTTFLRG